MLKRVLVELKDGWEVFLSLLTLIGALFALIVSDKVRAEVSEENEKLKYSLATACMYIDSLPKKYRATFDFCMEVKR
jgi:hypothetical protein